MKKGLFTLFFLSLILVVSAQEKDSLDNFYTNSADNLLLKDSKLVLGGYGEAHYNQPLNSDVRSNGKLDVHRLVMLLGYNFSDRVQFISELEFEHVKEIYVEQAFLQYKINNFLNLRAGLMLIPMGIINEYHEPTTFNGVERPTIDSKIAPTTWREIGFGFTGNVLPASLKYQVYLLNGFNGYDGAAKISGSNGLRSGRQKGAESYISSPNITGKIEYYGIRGLNIGLSGYFGKTQSSLYNGLDKNDDNALGTADSSVVGVSMIGLDARYSYSGFQFRGQFYYTSLSNTEQYNEFTSTVDGLNDVGQSMTGYYFEAGYDVFKTMKTEHQLISFVRYESLNTHNSVDENILKNDAYKIDIITTGLTWFLTKGAVIKADMQFVKTGADDEYSKIFNAGIGVMF